MMDGCASRQPTLSREGQAQHCRGLPAQHTASSEVEVLELLMKDLRILLNLIDISILVAFFLPRV